MTMSEFLFEERRRRAGEPLVARRAVAWSSTAAVDGGPAVGDLRARDSPRGPDLFDDASAAHPTDRSPRPHIIDGGYYDNFGVTSALDWLDPVLAARLGGRDLDFERVLIIQLRAIRRPNPRDVPPKSGAVPRCGGPLIGLRRSRDGAAVSPQRHRADSVRGELDGAPARAVNGRPVDGAWRRCSPSGGPRGPPSWHSNTAARTRSSWPPAGSTEDARKVTDYLATGVRCPGAIQ